MVLMSISIFCLLFAIAARVCIAPEWMTKSDEYPAPDARVTCHVRAAPPYVSACLAVGIGGVAAMLMAHGLPTGELEVILVLIQIASGLAIYWWFRSKVKRGDYDLVLDCAQRQMLLPRCVAPPTQQGPQIVRFDEVLEMRIESTRVRDSTFFLKMFVGPSLRNSRSYTIAKGMHLLSHAESLQELIERHIYTKPTLTPPPPVRE